MTMFRFPSIMSTLLVMSGESIYKRFKIVAKGIYTDDVAMMKCSADANRVWVQLLRGT